MRNKNYLVLVIGILLVVTLLITTVSARDFNIYNSSNFAQSFFIVNGSTGLVGVGTSTPQNLFNVLGAGNFTSNLTIDENVFFVNAINNRVGIGTSTPQNTLNVVGDLNVTGNFSSRGNMTFTGLNNYIIFSGAGGGLQTAYDPISIYADTDNNGAGNLINLGGNGFNNYLTLSNTGYVGIGTTIPDKVLEINSATGANLRLTYNDADGSATNYADFSMADDGALTIQTAGSDEDLELRTGTFDNAFFIDDSASKIGIGTSTPAQKLDVNGNIKLPSTGRIIFDSVYDNNYISNGATGITLGSLEKISLFSQEELVLESVVDVQLATYDNIVFTTGSSPTVRMNVTENGNVLVYDGTASVDYATGSGDLYVEDDLEVDGTLYTGSSIYGPVFYQGSYVVLDVSGFSYTNITDEPWIEDSQEGSLDVNSADYWDAYDTPSGWDLDASDDLTTSTSFAGGDITSGTYNSLVIADDSHNHVYSNIDAFTEANLYSILSDVTQFYESGDKVGDADTLDTHDSSYFQPNLAVSGTLLQKSGDTLSVKEGTLIDCKECSYDLVNGISCTRESLQLSGGIMTGTLNMNSNLITNIGNAGTDFTSAGGLNLAGTLNMNTNLITNIGNAGTDFTSRGGLNLADYLYLSALAIGSDYDLCIIEGYVSNCASNREYKKDIQNFTKGLEIVEKLRPVTFNWKSSGEKSLGFIAEEVEAIDPLYASYRGGNLTGVKYKQLTTVLTNAIKEQQVMIGDLNLSVNLSDAQIKKISDNLNLTNDKLNSSEKKIQELESQVENLQQQLTEIQAFLENGNLESNKTKVKKDVEEIEIVSSELKPVKLSSVLFGKIMNLF